MVIAGLIAMPFRPVYLIVAVAELAVVVLLGIVALRPADNTRRSDETAEQFAIRFVKAVTRDLDRVTVNRMLCADGYQYHEANMAQQITFWSGPEVITPPHDFRLVRSLQLPAEITGPRPEYKIWVAFRYRYLYQGKLLDIDMSDGWRIYVTWLDEGYCASPWAGN
jgi:hypothetical protein